MMAVSAGATHSFHKTVATLIDDDGGLTSTFTGGAGGARTRDQRIMSPSQPVRARPRVFVACAHACRVFRCAATELTRPRPPASACVRGCSPPCVAHEL
jgi:hypothetical protein